MQTFQVRLKENRPFAITVVIAVFFVLAHLIAAVVLCRERLFLDSPYYFFHVLNEESFRIEHQRIILALSQCLLLAGVKLHLSTRSLLVLYSITPVIYSGILIFISLLYFKSEAAAWLIMLSCVCGNYFLYFCPMYEVCYAVITFCFLCLLTQRRFYQTTTQLIIYTIVLMTALLGYPLIALACLALPVYHYVASEKKIELRIVVVYLCAFLIWFGIKYFFISDYEKGKISVSPAEYPGIIKSMLTWHFFADAVKYMFQFYREAFVVAFIFIALSLRNKNYLLAGLQLISMVAFVFFVNVGYRGNGLIFGNMFERMYLLLIPAGFAPFLLIGYPALQPRVKLIVVALLLGVVMLKTNNIWKHSAYYTYRLQILDGLESKLHQHCAKVAINWNSLPPELDQWSTGMEDLIYTSAHGRGCIISDTSVFHGHPLDNEHFVLRLDEVMDRKELNPVYFSLDSTPYCFAGGIDVVAAKQ